MNTGRTLWVITGPTAVGKTDHAIQLALKYNSPIVSADSRQIYNELNIGVAKPSEEQLRQVRHFFINHVSIHDDYNAGIYAMESRNLINELFETHEHLIVCGGTGLYINALLFGLDQLPSKDEKLRSELGQVLQNEGIGALQAQMQTLNPGKYSAMDINNPQRLIRAIEIEKSERPKTEHIPAFSFDFEVKTVMLNLPRHELYERINHRVDKMIEAGLEKEVYDLIEHQNLNALQTVGYAEWWPYFKGETEKDSVIDKIKQHTRNYAKRQLTWIRNKG